MHFCMTTKVLEMYAPGGTDPGCTDYIWGRSKVCTTFGFKYL